MVVFTRFQKSKVKKKEWIVTELNGFQFGPRFTPVISVMGIDTPDETGKPPKEKECEK